MLAGNQTWLVILLKKRKCFSWDYILDSLAREKVATCFLGDSDYPFLLSEIYNPPLIIYYRGNLNVNWEKSLSIVGSRKCSEYGRKIVSDFMPAITDLDITTVSGLAIGIDSEVHQKTLQNQGITVAVLGSGLDRCSVYPRVNRGLADEIVARGGVVMSEFPIGSEPLSFHFPQRNRIISGLSLAVLVVEAGMKSGSLITARLALEEGREVFSVPGDIFSDSFVGSNNLLKYGANVVAGVEDILPFFN